MTASINLQLARPGWEDEYPDIDLVCGMHSTHVEESDDYSPAARREDELMINLALIEGLRNADRLTKDRAKREAVRGWILSHGRPAVLSPEAVDIAGLV